MSKFLSTPSARRATKTPKQEKSTKVISIHALREEGDGTRRPMVPKPSNFYPRPPRGGRPKATEAAEAKEYFYPRPPRGGRRGNGNIAAKAYLISIHALREEGDIHLHQLGLMLINFYPRPPRGGRRRYCQRKRTTMRFLSTPSARRATHPGVLLQWPRTISIHALREEGDAFCRRVCAFGGYFYPRPPRGGRPLVSLLPVLMSRFLSTPSARRATGCTGIVRPMLSISIHALREEGDAFRLLRSLKMFLFLSTPSARRATAKTETKSLFSNKLYNILHEFRRALIYNGSKNYPNHAKRLENPVRRCRKNAENSPFAPGRETQNNSRPSCSKGG